MRDYDQRRIRAPSKHNIRRMLDCVRPLCFERRKASEGTGTSHITTLVITGRVLR